MAEQTKKIETQIVLGLDSDPHSIKLVKLVIYPEKVVFDSYAVVPVTGTLPEAILKACNQLNITDGEVNIALPGIACIVRRLQLPDMSNEEIPKALLWKLKNLVPFPVENAIINQVVLRKFEENKIKKIDLLAVAVQKETLHQQTAQLSGVGLKVGVATVPAFALWEIVKKSVSVQENQVVVVIDIGLEAASINFFKNNILALTRDISVAGDHLTKSMAGLVVADDWQLNLTYDQAEAIKVKYGIPSETSTEQTDTGIPLAHIRAIMKPTLRRMVNEISRSIEYYREQFQEEKIDRVVLTGGSSQILNLKEFLAENLSVPVEALNPLSNLILAPQLESGRAQAEGDAPRLTLALGLALCPQNGFNLIKTKPKKSMVPMFSGAKFNLPALQLDKLFSTEGLKNVNFGILSAAFLAVAIVFTGFAVNMNLDRQKAYWQKTLDTKSAELSQVRAVKERRDLLTTIMKEETKLREILAALSATLPSQASINALAFDNSKKQISMDGFAPDMQTVGQVIRNVEISPYFSQTTLLSARKIDSSNPNQPGTKVDFKISFMVDKS